MENKNKTIRIERALRLMLCFAVVGVLCIFPAFAENEYAKAGAQWILDGIYWIALAVIVWQIFKMVAARNVGGAVVLGIMGAIIVALIAAPEVLKTVGQKLLSTLNLA